MSHPPRNPRRAYDADGREIPPMTLANMRQNGARFVEAWCYERGCHHHAVIDVGHLPTDTPVPDIALRLRCSACGSKHVRTVPAWSQRQGARTCGR